MSGPFVAWDDFLVRSPLAAVDGSTLTSSVRHLSPSAGRAAHVELLRRAAAMPALAEAVAVASPSLAAILDEVLTDGAAARKDTQIRRAALAVLRYDIRMRFRPTPFGLFAGVGHGCFDSSTKVEHEFPPSTWTKPDMEWLHALVDGIEREPALLFHLIVQAHGAVVQRGARLCLDAPSFRVGKTQEWGRVSVRDTPAVRTALDLARAPVVVADLVASLRERFPKAGAAAAGRMVAGLLREGLLVTTLRPPLDGADPLAHVCAALGGIEQRLGAPLPVRARLEEFADLLAAYDAVPVGEGRPALREVVAAARELHHHDNPVHVDAGLGTRVRLPDQVRAEVERAVAAMWRLAPARRGTQVVREFHTRFLERYGAGRVVPLLDAVDETVGPGLPSGFGWPPSERPEQQAPPEQRHRRDVALAELVASALRDGRDEIVLDDAALERMAPETEPGGVTRFCEFYFRLVSPSAQHVDEGEFRLVIGPNPGSYQAGGTAGRFCGLLPDLAEVLRAHWADRAAEAEPVVYANLVYQPRARRAANVANAPALTGTHIPIGLPDSPGVPALRLADLGLVADLERLHVVHLRTGQAVVPVCHTMLSPDAQAPNVARLLYELGLEGGRLWEPWHWGAATDFPRLPRVVHGRTVLRPATWRADELRAAAERLDPRALGPERLAEAWAEEVAAWRQRWTVPADLLVLTADHRIQVDLTEAWHRELLCDELRKTPEIAFVETGCGLADGWFATGDGTGIAEFVVPLSAAVPPPRPRVPAAAAAAWTRRVHPPGGEWLYLKVESSLHVQTELVREYLPALVAEAEELGADRWFFIRYSEPGTVLRLRFHGPPDRLWPHVLPRVAHRLQSWLDTRLAGSWSIAAYDPEWERYGGPAAQQAVEEVFQADSELAVSLLQEVHRPGSPFDVDTLAVVSVAALAHAFGPPSPGAPDVRPCPGDPAASWLATTGTRAELPRRFRADRERWRTSVDPVGGWPVLAASEPGARVVAALRARDAAVARYGELVRGRVADELAVVGSLLHMTCNRIFGGPADREQEVLGLARGALLDNFERRRRGA
ncbi:thiopeptide-type bacteriocin biosynthesis protein [Crossiella equi]|uniref:Thiopeptide-type bacteriocin biosynthesis protein n=1 Tax=Crossiella equi TaxID=130796 RepID=A0ABS5ABM0_9PSEU|nr:lantibiotic dehydratase [Crossiella equi]MBP2473993.1 thiopeptide-type bacteriocin biosynthesis protein [Crossiella equi]